jgi:hypothetical protein
MTLLPKYSSAGGAGGEAAMPLKRSRVSSPKAELCRLFNASEVLPSFAAPSDPGGDSRPNFAGTEEAIGPFLAIQETPLLSNEAGKGASKTLSPLCAEGESPKPKRFKSSSLGEP